MLLASRHDCNISDHAVAKISSSPPNLTLWPGWLLAAVGVHDPASHGASPNQVPSVRLALLKSPPCVQPQVQQNADGGREHQRCMTIWL